jgi:hypothetical protein
MLREPGRPSRNLGRRYGLYRVAPPSGAEQGHPARPHRRTRRWQRRSGRWYGVRSRAAADGTPPKTRANSRGTRLASQDTRRRAGNRVARRGPARDGPDVATLAFPLAGTPPPRSGNAARLAATGNIPPEVSRHDRDGPERRRRYARRAESSRRLGHRVRRCGSVECHRRRMVRPDGRAAYRGGQVVRQGRARAVLRCPGSPGFAGAQRWSTMDARFTWPPMVPRQSVGARPGWVPAPNRHPTGSTSATAQLGTCHPTESW